MPSRFDTLFSLRYAVRVLERQSRFWRHMDGALRVLSILAGSSALAAMLTNTTRFLQVAALVLFAFLQALEFSLQPGLKAAEAWVARMPYLEIITRANDLDDAALASAYMCACQSDDISAFESLRHVAYNDVLAEKGCDPADRFTLDKWQKLMSALA